MKTFNVELDITIGSGSDKGENRVVKIQADTWTWLANTVRFYGEKQLVVAEFNATRVLFVKPESSEVKDD